jgi:tetratricopeptide (TPR) repeat protein
MKYLAHAVILTNLAHTYYRIKDYHSAAHYYEEALESYHQLDKADMVTSSAKDLARCYRELSFIDKYKEVCTRYDIRGV